MPSTSFGPFATVYGTYRVIFPLFYLYFPNFGTLTSYNSVFPYSSYSIPFISFEPYLSSFIETLPDQIPSMHSDVIAVLLKILSFWEMQFGTSRRVSRAPGRHVNRVTRVATNISVEIIGY